MSVTIRLPNGDVEVVQDCPRDVTCKQVVVDWGLIEVPADGWVVVHDGACVDERPVAEFEGRTLLIKARTCGPG